MVDGGSNIVEADWESVSSILQVVRAAFGAACPSVRVGDLGLAAVALGLQADLEQPRVLLALFSRAGKSHPRCAI